MLIKLQRKPPVRGIVYPILNYKSPIPIKTRITRISILKIYVTSIMTYMGTAQAPYVVKNQQKLIKVVQMIGLRTITELSTYVKVILRSSKILTVQENIKIKSRAMFYKNTKSLYPHLRNLSFQVVDTAAKTRIKPRLLQWAISI